MATYFRPLILTAGRSKSAYFSRRDDSKLTSNRTLSQLYVDREAAQRAIERYRKHYPMDTIVYSEIEEVDGSRESNPARRGSARELAAMMRASGKPWMSDLEYLRLGNKTLKVMPGSPRQREIQERMREIERSYVRDSNPVRRESNPARKPTIYEALRAKLGREPTHAELKADVERIKREALQELAEKGKLRHQRRRNPVKKRANDLTAEAMEGYNGEPLKYLYSSPSWYAYKIGEYFRLSGRPEPSDVRMGRGYSINVRDMTFSFGKKDAITRVK